MTYDEAVERGYIDCHHFLKCPYCESTDIDFDNDENVYNEDICGLFVTVEGTIKCNCCNRKLGYFAHGISEVYYLEEL